MLRISWYVVLHGLFSYVEHTLLSAMGEFISLNFLLVWHGYRASLTSNFGYCCFYHHCHACLVLEGSFSHCQLFVICIEALQDQLIFQSAVSFYSKAVHQKIRISFMKLLCAFFICEYIGYSQQQSFIEVSFLLVSYCTLNSVQDVFYIRA